MLFLHNSKSVVLLLIFFVGYYSFRTPYSGLKLNTKLHHSSSALSTDATVGSIMTLSRFLIEATRSNPDHADFESLIESIQLGCKTICNTLARSGVAALDYDINSQNDIVSSQKLNSKDSKLKANKLYDRANAILKNALKFTGKIGVVTSQNEEPILIEESWNSPYIAVFDPLDGSSNIDVGIVTGISIH